MEFNVPFTASSPHGYQPSSFVPGPQYINPSQHYDGCLPQPETFALDFAQYPAQHFFFPSPPIPSTTIRHGPQGLSPVSDGSPAYINSNGNSNSNSNSNGENVQSEVVGQREHVGSEEDDPTPAQSRRKAQNRAAQRAFRERKERHIRDLESKLADLEAAQKETAGQNEQLRQNLHKITTENDILRATSTSLNHTSSRSNTTDTDEDPTLANPAQTTGPMVYKPTDFFSNLLQEHPNRGPLHRISTSDDGQRLYAAGATWDYIVGHELYKRGEVDILRVCDGIRHRARCDGQGPVFAERDIEGAIRLAAVGGSDDLL